MKLSLRGYLLALLVALPAACGGIANRSAPAAEETPDSSARDAAGDDASADAREIPDALDPDAWMPPPWSPPADAKPSTACGSGVIPPADGYQDIMANGEARRFVIHLPAGYDGTRTFPAIFVYHSLGETALQFEKAKFNFPALAHQTAVLVEMEGLLVSGVRSFERNPPDDLVYTDAVIAWLKGGVCFDTSRMYAVGQSTGATFVEILGCQRSDVLRAVAANVPHQTDVSMCKGPIASWFSYGTQQSAFLVQQQQAMLAFWQKEDRCDVSTATLTDFPPCVSYTCDPKFPLQSCAYDGQHPWPDFASPAVFQFFLGF
jgi:poly(3-hydroxybutyrate) depolymerase